MATGESSAHIDADVSYDVFGLPYLSGKTFKGLLRESAIEVCEILELNNTNEIIETLFGKAGKTDGGHVVFNNFKLFNYEAIANDLKHQVKISSKFVQSYFTTIRKQITIENGVAADKSLRTYRLIKNDLVFIGDIEYHEVEYLPILKKALINLRHLGTRRNRGFGKVEIRIIQEQSEVIENPIYNNLSPKLASKNCKLTFTITNISPLLIAKPIGDQNTVATEDYIPAQNIKGLVAGLLIQEGKVSGKLHSDEIFKRLILNGTICYQNCIPSGNKLIPFGYGSKKIEKSEAKKIYNAFIENDSKPESGWYNIEANKFIKYDVATGSNFHSARNEKRIAGRNTKGDIFYYDYIEENQQFRGEIIGDYESLLLIKGLLETKNGKHRLGRSKTAQYAEVAFSKIELEDIVISTPINKGTEFYVLFQSPVIIYNKNGMAIPDFELLNEEFKNYKIEIKGIISKTTFVESYMGVWKSKTNRENAFAMGTTLKVKAIDDLFVNDLDNLFINGIGEKTYDGYGRLALVELADELTYSKHVKPLPEIKPFQSETVKNIEKEFEKKKRQDEIKLAAIQNTKDLKLNNNQVYRLKEKLLQCVTLNEWQEFLTGLENKSAGKTLKAEYLYEMLLSLNPNIKDIIVTTNGTDISDEVKLYWKTFFTALRKKSKKD